MKRRGLYLFKFIHQENTLNFLGIQEEIKINSTKYDVNIQNEFNEKFLQKKLSQSNKPRLKLV